MSSEIPDKNNAGEKVGEPGEGVRPSLVDIARRSPYVLAPEKGPASPAGIPPLNTALFLLTLLTTTMAGAYMAGADLTLLHPLASLVGLASGLSFSIPLMLILLCHEMGHYVTARRNRVDATLPYFIPAPFPSFFIIGTFGAFIKMKSLPPSRRVMFDIGAAGPWAGVLVAIPTVIIGLMLSTVTPLNRSMGGLELGNSLLFLGLARVVLHVNPNAVNVNMSPVAFAGWLGLFVTTLNLLPVGQLDGGHVVYALFGRRHRTISRLFVLGCVLMVVVPYIFGMEFWWGWLLWAAILLFLGLGHPVTTDADTPLDPGRRIAAWATVALFVLTFCPVPATFNAGQPPSEENLYQVMQVVPSASGGAERNREETIGLHPGAALLPTVSPFSAKQGNGQDTIGSKRPGAA
jgi:membrane-associated protease RseP (regulator of RpoE activity)